MWTFAFFNRLKGEPVYRDGQCVIVKNADGSYEGVCWNLCRDGRDALTVTLDLPADGPRTLLTSVADEDCCNPLKAWHEMGEPASLTAEEVQFLRAAAQPRCASAVVEAGRPAAVVLGPNGVGHFVLRPYKPVSEYGYDYNWYMEHA